jgi:Carboxypeptidase regulatory-like domain
MSSVKLRWSKLLSCLVCAMLLYGLGMAQSVTGTVSGTVVDTSGKVIAGAKVMLSDERTGSARVATSNEDGDFIFPTLQPGVYTIKIEHSGFRTFQRTNNVLSANETLALGKLTLEVGQLVEVVTTVAEGAIVERESSDLTARLTSDQIELISTKGRDITSLLRLPGVINSDLALFKNFNLGEKRRLRFTWETYNLFNHTNFRDIDGGLTFTLNTTTGQVTQTNPRFGQPISARSPRVMQGSLRLNF